MSSPNYIIRKLHPDDYHRNYLSLLEQLTSTQSSSLPPISYEQFNKQFKRIHNTNNISIYVMEDTNKNNQTFGQIIATATLMIEPKFIHNCGQVAHIEDVVVNQQLRGHGLGKHLINTLNNIAKQANCYKIILSCNESNIPFYEKCGYQLKENTMANYFDQPKL